VQVAYDLKVDEDRISAIQRATLNTPDFGIEPTDGLFGSAEWWETVESGNLVTHTLSGTVTRVYMGSMNDWPMFQLTDDSGAKSEWTREVNTREQDALYVVGRAVEVDYVIQRHKPQSWDKGAETKCVVQIRVEA
jgi:hypothetical protein